MRSFVLSLCLIISVLSMPLQKVDKWDIGKAWNQVTRTAAPLVKPIEKTIVNTVDDAKNVVVAPIAKHVDHAANTIKKETIQVSRGVCKAVVNTALDTAKFADSAIREVKELSDMVQREIGNVVNAIKAALQSLRCDISANDIFKIAKELAMSSSNIFSILKETQNYEKLASGWSYLEEMACRMAWNRIYNVSPMVAIVITFLKTLHSSCPALNKGGNPAISLGVGVAAGASSLYDAEVSAEMGLAVDRFGERYCYVGGCVSIGMTLPPIPDVGTDTGLHLSIWTNPNNIGGSSDTLGLSGTIGAFGLEISPSIDYIYGNGRIQDFLGFSCSGTVGATSAPVKATLGFSAGTCYTPVFLKYKPLPAFRFPFGNFRGFRGFSFSGLEESSNASLLSLTSNDTNYDTTEPCAHEGETCICNGNVFYGVNEDYAVRTIEDHIDCSAEMFQNEGQPEVQSGADKICVCVGVDYDLGYRCADEGDTCYCHGGVTYGARGFYDSAIVHGSILCSSDNFGDPVPGITKHCYCNE